MSLFVAALAVVVVVGASQGFRKVMASSEKANDVHRAVLEQLNEYGAYASPGDFEILVPFEDRVALIDTGSSSQRRLMMHDALVAPGEIMSVALPLRSLHRLSHQLVREWEPLGPGVWPGGAFDSPEICRALREQHDLHRAMRHLLEQWPMLAFTLDEESMWTAYVSHEIIDQGALGAFWKDFLQAVSAWEDAASSLVEVATAVRGIPGDAGLPVRPLLIDGAIGVEGNPIAVPLRLPDDTH